MGDCFCKSASPRNDIDYSIAEKMAENSCRYLMDIQFENGAFTAGNASMTTFGQPGIFNTGQILLGLADVYETKKNFSELIKGIDADEIKKAKELKKKFEANKLELEAKVKSTRSTLE